MNWNDHSRLKGSHAPFSPSQPAWLRYDSHKLLLARENQEAKKRGTELHEWAEKTINLGIKQKKTKQALNAYVNDAIGFAMDTEKTLYYSGNFYGTADAICFRDGLLRIHDLKTGKTPVRMDQLLVYAALFCLEYRYDPIDISIELRIYQGSEVIIHEPVPEEVQEIMDIIVEDDKLLRDNGY